MEDLTSLTYELKKELLSVNGYKDKEDYIIKHIQNIEKESYHVDDLPTGLDWFNTSKPLSKCLLNGKIVVLDFFTYCCINCLHIIPHLRELEENYSVADGLVVIGVHSAKFSNEKNSKNILSALKRYNISHPVVNDKDCYLFNRLNLSCWPTILILGPQRQPLFVLVGEGHRDELLLFVKVALNYYKSTVSSHQLPLYNCDQIITSSLLSFPGKVTRWKNLLAISDSGNHRVLIVDFDGHIRLKIGGNTPGFKDGSFETARFNSPQGLTFYNSNIIYIADTENHAIREANLDSQVVKTVVGNGIQGTDYLGGKTGNLQEISSPWDVCIVPCSDVEVTSVDYFTNVVSNASLAKPISPPPLPLPVKQSLYSNIGSTKPPPPPPPLPIPQSLHTHGDSTKLPPPPPPLPIPQSLHTDADSTKLSPPPPPPPLITTVLSKTDCRPPIPTASTLSSQLPVIDPVNATKSKVLLIAAAGIHQIWAYFIDSGTWWKGKKYTKNICVAVAGSGKEENRNNRYPMMASFAQPSGLSYSENLKAVFIADSESSSIRRLNLKDGSVVHVAGGSRSPDDLFSYGDSNGKTYEAKFQHPLGITWNSKENCLYVCDTYNHKIKKIDSSGFCESIHEDANYFSEPSGCCLNEAQDVLFVADTNNNCLQAINLTDFSVKKIDIKEPTQSLKRTPLKNIWETWEAEAFLSKSGGILILNIVFSPEEIHGKWKLNVDDSHVKANSLKGKLMTNTFESSLSVLPSKINTTLEVFFDLVLCGSDTCSLKKIVLKLFIRRKETSEKTVFCSLKKSLL